MPNKVVDREDLELRFAITAAGAKGLSVDRANEHLKTSGVSAKGHAKQTFGKIVFDNNGGKGRNSFAVIDNKIMTREALIEYLKATAP